MNDWAYTFDPVSKKAWVEQIVKDLRGKPLDTLLHEWWPGETIQPIIHQEDAGKTVVRLPDDLFKAPPRITELINTDGVSASDVNARMLDALKFGAETILIHCDSVNKIPLEEWLKDVHLDMVKVQLEPLEFSLASNHTLTDFLSIGVEWRVVRTNESPNDLQDVISRITEAGISLQSIQFVYEFPSLGAWDKNTRHRLNQFTRDLRRWCETGKDQFDFFNQTILKVESDKSYFKHIIQTRVLHLLWHNLITHNKIDSVSVNNHYLECHIRDDESEKPDQYLISASMSALAASLSGTQSLCIHNLNGSNIDEFYNRTNRNIHHLLNLESNIYAGTDPLAGALAIDYYTINWTKRIWEGLILEK